MHLIVLKYYKLPLVKNTLKTLNYLLSVFKEFLTKGGL